MTTGSTGESVTVLMLRMASEHDEPRKCALCSKLADIEALLLTEPGSVMLAPVQGLCVGCVQAAMKRTMSKRLAAQELLRLLLAKVAS